MLKRVPTAFDDRIYGPDWRAWVDPEVPDEIAPTALLLDQLVVCFLEILGSDVFRIDTKSPFDAGIRFHEVPTTLRFFSELEIPSP